VDAVPIRVEFVLEGRIPIGGALDPDLGVPVLDRIDMYAEKLLANADRALDHSQMSRDLIDLAMMIEAWGPIPAAALEKAEAAYGRAIRDYFDRGLALLREERHCNDCLQAMAMPSELGRAIIATLETQQFRLAAM
ncbi:MAG: hypothetical protein EPN69_05905, partial [Rhodanobacter sp.]